jgi:PAS domain S-box-containing protein
MSLRAVRLQPDPSQLREGCGARETGPRHFSSATNSGTSPDHLDNLANPLVQQALLADALDTAPLLVFVADEEMRYVAVNQTACEALGYARAELLGLRVTDVAVASEAGELYERMLQSRSQEGSTPIRTKDGRLLLFFYNARDTIVAGMRYYVAVGFLESQLPPVLRG